MFEKIYRKYSQKHVSSGKPGVRNARYIPPACPALPGISSSFAGGF
jgi:hypothetical protein